MNETNSIRERYQWKRVEAPKRWYPKEVGQELVGFYSGKTVRNGTFGQYEVVLISVPARGVFMLSGVQIVQLVDASAAEIGWPLRVVWQGSKKLDGDRTMKCFELFVAEGDPISPEDMPAIKPQEAQPQ